MHLAWCFLFSFSFPHLLYPILQKVSLTSPSNHPKFSTSFISITLIKPPSSLTCTIQRTVFQLISLLPLLLLSPSNLNPFSTAREVFQKHSSVHVLPQLKHQQLSRYQHQPKLLYVIPACYLASLSLSHSLSFLQFNKFISILAPQH